MAKYSGFIGYAKQVKVKPGVYQETIKPHRVRGDVINLKNSVNTSDEIVSDIQLNHRISIIADKTTYSNFATIRYITYMGVKWRVASVEVARPRLVITTGGVWNGH